MTNIAKEMFDVMEEEGRNGGGLQGSTIGEVLSRSYSDSKTLCPSPNTPTPVPLELTFAMRPGDFADLFPSQSLLLPFRLQAVGNLMPTDMKCLSFNMSPNLSSQGSSQTTGKYKVAGGQNEIMQEVAEESPDIASPERPNDSKATIISPKIPNLSSNTMPVARGSAAVPPPPPPPLSTTPPIPPIQASIGSALMPSPPMPLTKGAAPPPPPPLGVAKALRPKKATTKLKRSTHMGNMYRILKGKVEGSGLNDKVRRGSRTQIGASVRGQQGMADALAEMTKRSFSFDNLLTIKSPIVLELNHSSNFLTLISNFVLLDQHISSKLKKMFRSMQNQSWILKLPLIPFKQRTWLSLSNFTSTWSCIWSN